MKSTAGIWIDHRRAIIVTSSDKEKKTTEILSNVETQQEPNAVKHSLNPFESPMIAADDDRRKELTGHLNVFYNEVASSIRDAESILLFGPGEAMGELQKQMAKNGLDEHIVEIETVDKMTLPQIVSKVHRFFLAVPA
jgi:ABC-type branched-subunit amino acid transport system substrate-binding protein